jgi:diacylglycerol kinase family enzyme
VSGLRPFTELTVRGLHGRELPLQVDGDYFGEVVEAKYSILPRALNIVA